MNAMVGKEPKVSLDKRPAMTRARGQRSHSCRCGQQLDVCARAHCPRCGRAVDRA